MKSDTHETWKEIDWTDGKYSVSDLGRMRNNETGDVLKPSIRKRGYLKINLTVNGVRYSKSLHRLIATAFIPNPENKPEVNHINGIHDDNRVCNLEWVTPEENARHSAENKLREKGIEQKRVNSNYESWNDKCQQSYLKRSDRITEDEYNKLLSLAEEKETTIYGLYNELLKENKTLKNQIEGTEQNIFMIKCLKKELKRAQGRANWLESTYNLKRASIGLQNGEYDLGNKRNHLTIIGYCKDTTNKTILVCRCDCGAIKPENPTLWRTGKVKSCGCMHDALCRKEVI